MEQAFRSSVARWLVAALALGAAVPAIAATQSVPAAASARWQVDWGDLYCGLTRTAAAATPEFVIRIIPGTGRAELLIAAADSGPVPLANGEAVVTLLPTGRRFTAEAAVGRAGRRQVAVLKNLRLDYLVGFAAAEGFEVTQGRAVRMRTAFPVARDAIAALQRCADGAMAEWGLDPAGLASLRQWPELERPWLTADDYPRQAMRTNATGMTVVRLSIDREGRITQCAPVATSGSPELDQISCRSATTRGRYRPALGADGAPTAADIAVEIRWWTG